MPDPVPPPEHWEADVAVRDGRTVRIRPITADDGERLATFHRSLSDETVYFRFFAPYPELTERDVERFTNVDHVDRVALVATVGGELVGVGRYDRVNATEAEVAFVIRDDHQGRGLGSVLLEHLAAAARERGVKRFVAEVLPTNRRMLSTFQEAGYHPSHKLEDGVVSLSFDIRPSDSSEEVRLAREHRAEALSVAALVSPESVVVVGAGRDPASLGHRILSHLQEGGFTGTLSAVNRAAAAEGQQVLGVPTYASVSDIPDPPVLAVVAVPADEVLAVVDDCAAAGGVRGLLVVSSGYAEIGAEGAQRQRTLVRRARGHGMRVIGPNALGIVNTDPDVSLNASLAPAMPGRAAIGFFCQSGSLSRSVLGRAVRRGLGVSTFVSAGNRADVSGNDLLQYWQDDEQTDVVLLYLESLGNPRKFTRVARRLSRSKPVVAMRTGRSTQAYPLGHTVRRTSLPPAAVDAVFAQAGVVEVDSLGQMFDAAGLLAFQPLPIGRNVAVVGNSDALAVLTTDALEVAGLRIVGEPVTLAHDCTPHELASALAAVIEDPAVDSVVVAHVPMLGSHGRPWERVVAETVLRRSKPVVAVLVAAEDDSGLIPPPSDAADLVAEHASVPFYGTVEEAVLALQRVTRYAEWRKRDAGEVPELEDVRPAAARAVVADVLAHAGGTGGDTDVLEAIDPASPPPDDAVVEVELLAERVDDALTELLAAYGIEVWPVVPVGSEDQAVAAARELGFPVALKTLDPRFASRTDLGAVRLNIENERAVQTAYLSMVASLDPDAIRHLVVQRLARPGVACVVASAEDPLFGPVVTFGLAGVVPELLGDRGYRIPPLTDQDARDLIRTPGAAPLLHGYGGTAPVDVDALEDLLVRVGQLSDDLPELADLRLEPVIVSPGGLAVLGARATVRRAEARWDSATRRLGI
ncbi:MAG TPA: GNAT family N-acetyltransferase [Candidatus Nanopelagicales bacterium]|nr:GNAT family N-acetyltransferase [Candidatus Nanopelagicales bacterium]